MKKLILTSSALLLVAIGAIVYSCKPKMNSDNAITPTYKDGSTGTGANPNINVVTVTGTSTLSNPATENSSLQVGSGAGWLYAGCAVGGTELTGFLGDSEVRLVFGNVPTDGTYTLTNQPPTLGMCRITVKNAPGQPAGILWYSKSGIVTVTTNTNFTPTQITATFCGVPCIQQTFLFPVVTICGQLICI